MTRSILIAGIGNIFFGDDAFGCEVAQRLSRRSWPRGVRVKDFGIRGIDLAYELADGYDAVILIDAAPLGGKPGDLAVIEPEMTFDADEHTADVWNSHTMDPVHVLRLANQMGAVVGRILLVGCEPTPLADDTDILPGLSAAVSQAVDRAVELVRTLVNDLLKDPRAVNERRAELNEAFDASSPHTATLRRNDR